MKNVTIRQLRYFNALAQTGHFGQAAELCAVSQPALSMQIKELETELGAPLVERRPSGAQLTPLGREIAQRANEILILTQGLSDLAESRARVLSGALSLGVIPTIAPYLLPATLNEIRRSYPGLDLRIRETRTETLVADLLSGALDLLLLALPVDHPEVETLELLTDSFMLAAPQTGPTPTQVLSADDLLQASRILLLEEGHCFRDHALEVCEMHRRGEIDTLGASSLATIVRMVANGMGVTLLPKISVDTETRGLDLRLLDFPDPAPSRSIGLAWRKSSPRKRDFEEVGKMIRRAMR
ncbi:MAG: hydrogen peroxide-inducible genes activator [Marinibacterium sp.]|nr:hydrogen peroxide-inducible genes activator [Marinibacterium sp.]